MSFVFNWEAISQNGKSNVLLKNKINEYLQKNGDSLLPSYIRNAFVHHVDIGNTAPEITLKNISDPLSSIYSSLIKDCEMDYQSKIVDGHNLENISVELYPNNLDAQMVLDFKYAGELSMSFKADLSINYPSENFVKLPLQINISHINIHSLILVAYLNPLIKATYNYKNRTNYKDTQTEEFSVKKSILAILCDVEDEAQEMDKFNISGLFTQNKTSSNINLSSTPIESNKNTHSNNNHLERVMFIQDITINTVIGEGLEYNSDKSILRNIEDLEAMIIEFLRKFIRDELCYPNWIEFDL
ncbi:uncharacterized protein HGUI_00723 [Hanseniaspora guilliermondii]|uniref:SMP-LTD domain-containing protein n=1 Tax=Hanseniaspora guilliermondii TaxID=56406 RepID=A0A1L0B0N1_9ASCO|nr:uncharacterized protein HGUI_00723 [Hanseniaspora guilliermondii]